MSIAKLLHKALTPQIAPMVYVMMFVSLFIGAAFFFGFVDVSESILYQTGVLIPSNIWGGLLMITALIAEIGFFKKSQRLIQLGGLYGFMAWLLACIDLAMSAHWYVFVTVGLFHLIFHGYVVLAASLGYLLRRPL